MQFEGRVAAVTGAAGGLGRAYAGALAARGAAVAILDRDGEQAESVATQIRADGGNAAAFGADLTRWDSVAACFASLLEWSGDRLDILVNNAGGGSSSPGNASSIAAITPGAWHALMDANLTTAFLSIRAAAPAMQRRRHGKIVNVASRSARVADPKFEQSPAYACAKTAVLGLTRFAARELGPHGITVNCIVPGLVLSGPVLEEYWTRLGPDAQHGYLQELALRRLPRLEEIVEPVLFFCGPGSDYVTGTSLDVNGGSYMPP